MFKKTFVSILTTNMLLISLGTTINVLAHENQSLDDQELNVEWGELDHSVGDSTIKPRFVNDFRNRKRNVKRYDEWSPYKRVSDNIQTGRAGGKISSNRSVTFGVDITGNILGLGIATRTSISSQKGYTLNVGPNKRVYMGYRVKYKVETGINEVYDVVTGKVIRKNRYTVKTPQYGEYKLINY